jgi:peptidoglycan/LPS O-acetylase OafA/YrhL
MNKKKDFISSLMNMIFSESHIRHIDGLRALAVLGVLAAHAEIPFLTGGYAGVDVFFVISGYLITSLILRGLSNKNFSLIVFYQRRVRRLLPTLLVVVIACIPFASLLLLPDKLENFGQSAIATVLSANNVLLYLTSGYWEQESAFKPLLHTWSLGVEEQFYIFFPVVLMLVFRFARRLIKPLFWAALVAALLGATYQTSIDPDAAFYLIFARSWELLAGAVLALPAKAGRKKTIQDSAKISKYAADFGLVLILSSFIFFSGDTLAPGPVFLLPVLGTVLVIKYGANRSVTNWLLTHRSAILLGVSSYSIYLWHQPIFAFTRVASKTEPDLTMNLFLTVISLAVGILSYKFIEIPTRDSSRFPLKKLISAVSAGSLLALSSGVYFYVTAGIPSRFGYSVQDFKEESTISYNMSIFNKKTDSFPKEVGPKLLVIGNSFARDSVNALLEVSPSLKLNIVYRDDIEGCLLSGLPNQALTSLVDEAQVVLFASGEYSSECIVQDIDKIEGMDKSIFFLGSKKFGYNLNWLMTIPAKERPNQFTPLEQETIDLEKKLETTIPASNFVSLLSGLSRGNDIQVTNSLGKLLSQDGRHLTKAGARFVAEKCLAESKLVRELRDLSLTSAEIEKY